MKTTLLEQGGRSEVFVTWLTFNDAKTTALSVNAKAQWSPHVPFFGVDRMRTSKKQNHIR